MEKDTRDRYIQGALIVGASGIGSGQDFTAHGTTTGSKIWWDQSANEFNVQGKLNITGSTTLTTAGRVYKEINFQPNDFDVTNASAALGQWNSTYPTIAMTPTEAGSSDVTVYTWRRAPNDIDTSTCMTAYAMWSADTAAASQAADFSLKWRHYGDGEATAGTTGSTAEAKFTANASDANVIEVSTISTAVDPPAVGDLMGFNFIYQASGSSTTGSDFQLHGLTIRYTANKLGAAT